MEKGVQKIYRTEKYHNLIIIFLRPKKEGNSYRILFYFISSLPLQHLRHRARWILRKIFNAFRLEVQLRENEITMGKAFVSYFPSSGLPPSGCWLSTFSFRNCFEGEGEQLCFHFLLCWAIFLRAAGGAHREFDKQCLQWRIEFQSESSNSSVACSFGRWLSLHRGPARHQRN